MIGTINTMNTTDELLQAYTALFTFLGGSISMTPGQSDLPHFCDAGLLRNLPVESRNENFMLASRLLKSPCPFKQQCHTTVDSNYDTLLSGEKSASAYPAASHWRTSRDSTTDHHRTLNQLYNRYNYSSAEDSGLEPDHLGMQLLFVNLLIEKYLTEDNYEIRDTIRKDLSDFINTEMLSWLPQWAEQVTGSSVTKCYSGISGLIVGGLEDVRDILSQKLGL